MSKLLDLRDVLLRGLRVELTPQQGYEAFERHQLLAIRFHRAARLNRPDLGERAGWRRYFNEHFPRGEEHALRLWEYWRTSLLKDEYPGSGVAISHGWARAHWKLVDPGQQLFVNLESMWDDFETSVDRFIEMLDREPERKRATLEWWSTRQWSVGRVTYPPLRIVSSITASASATAARADLVGTVGTHGICHLPTVSVTYLSPTRPI